MPLAPGILLVERFRDGYSSSCNADFERSSEETIYVYTERSLLNPNYVRENCGYTIATRHPYDNQQVLLNIRCDLTAVGLNHGDAKKDGPCNLWKVTASYGAWNPAERGTPSQAANPLSMPPRVSFDYEMREIPVWLDREGNSIRNTAGDSFDPPITFEYYNTIIRIERNERADFDLSGYFALNNKINQDPWLCFDKETVKIMPIVVPLLEYSQEARIYYRPMVYTLVYNPFTWYAQPLNAGYRELYNDGGTLKLREVRDDSGTVVGTPALLDDQGKALKPGFDPKKVLTGKIGIYFKTDFSVLGFDNILVPPPVL